MHSHMRGRGLKHEMPLVQHTTRWAARLSGKSGLDLTYDWTARRTKSGHVPFDPGRLAKGMVQGVLAEPWLLRGYQEDRLREFLGCCRARSAR